MKCDYCNGTGKYKKPNNQEEFERIIDVEMDKAYFINGAMAREKAFKRVGYTIIDCPHCKISNMIQRVHHNEKTETIP